MPEEISVYGMDYCETGWLDNKVGQRYCKIGWTITKLDGLIAKLDRYRKMGWTINKLDD